MSLFKKKKKEDKNLLKKREIIHKKMNDYQKEYIEFRLILLGYNKVGKKSFIDRLFNIPSTTIIRNKELELQYKKLIYQLRKKYEKHKKFLENLQPLDKKSRKKEEFIKLFYNISSYFKCCRRKKDFKSKFKIQNN